MPAVPAKAASLTVVFASGTNDELDLWLMQSDGGALKRLTHLSGRESLPAWSPDGRRIAFSYETGDQPSDLFIIGSDGKGQRQLTRTADTEEVGTSWSPDGNSLLFAAARSDQDLGDLMVVDVNTGVSRMLAAGVGAWPDWSPDGRHIVYSGSNPAHDDWRLWTMDSDGSHRRPLTPTSLTAASEPSWSPGGKLIAFIAASGSMTGPNARNWNEDIWTISPDGGDLQRVVSSPGNDHWPPAWSIDNHELLYTADGTKNQGEIMKLNLRTRQVVALTANRVQDMTPDWLKTKP